MKLQRELIGKQCAVNIQNTILAAVMALLGEGESVCQTV